MELMEDVAWFLCVLAHVCVCDQKLLSLDKLITTLLKTSADLFSHIKLYFAKTACVCTFVKQKN